MEAQLTTMTKGIKHAIKSEASKLAAAKAALAEATAGAGGGGGASADSAGVGGIAKVVSWVAPVMGTNVEPGVRVRVKQSSGEKVVGTVRFVGSTDFYKGGWQRE